jgi:hypothetical protein
MLASVVHLLRYRREELRIQAWENRERRKAELRMKTTEVRIHRIIHRSTYAIQPLESRVLLLPQEQFS